MISRNKTKSKFNTISVQLSLIVILMIIAGVQIRVLSIIAFIFSAILVFVLNPQEKLVMMFALMPFATIFKLSSESQSFFTFLQILYVVISLFYKKEINKNFLIAFLFFFF